CLDAFSVPSQLLSVPGWRLNARTTPSRIPARLPLLKHERSCRLRVRHPNPDVGTYLMRRPTPLDSANVRANCTAVRTPPIHRELLYSLLSVNPYPAR